jgi:hypothetical protein
VNRNLHATCFCPAGPALGTPAPPGKRIEKTKANFAGEAETGKTHMTPTPRPLAQF